MTVFDFANDQRIRPDPTMIVRRVHYCNWVLRVLAWDGVLPVVVLLVPNVIKVWFPNRRGIMEATAIILPITALFFRFVVGKRHINSNRCTRLVRCLQLVALCVAIFHLLIIDSLMILALELPQNAMFATDTDVIVWAVLFSLYLSCMAFAMYPGSTEELSTIEYRDLNALRDLSPNVESSQ